MKNRHLIPAVLLLWASAGLRAQTVADSLTQAVADSPVQVVDSLVQAQDSVVQPVDSLAAPVAVVPADTTTVIEGDTLALQPLDSVAADTVRRRPPRPSLPASMRPYFVLKVTRDDGARGFRLDTVSRAYERLIGVLDYLNDPSTPERYIRLTPDYYRLFLPLTYYERPIARLSDVRRPSPGPDTLKAAAPCPLWTDTLAFTRQERADEATDRALLAAYLGHMDLVRFTEAQIEAGPTYRDNIEREERSRPSVLKLFKSESMRYVKPDDADVVIHKPNWWVTGGSGSLQFSQSHISDNWYNGGEGTHSLLGNLQLFANYNDREKWQWESLLDAKLGFISAPSDEYHNYLVNNDQLRIASKVGLQAIKNWYYTLHTEFKTQFCNGYGANSQTLSAAFLSPAYWTTGLGMDFKLNKPKVTLSVVLSPLTYTMKIVTNPDVNEVSFGLDEGATTAHDFGSQVQANLTWQVFSFLNVTSRFDYLTSYETVRIEWENTFNFTLNRYLSAKLYVYGRFDDGVAPAENGSYFQINENFGFGLNYTW